LGQARALGAVGVLPKQIKPTDVSKVLYQLHLVPDRRTSEQTSFRPISVAVQEESEEGPATPAPPRVLTETSLREQFAELRRALVAGIDTQTDRITAEVRALLLEAMPPPSPVPESTVPPPRTWEWGWAVAAVALAIAFATTALWWYQSSQLDALTA